IGLIWFDDGQAIYIYDSAEMKNAVISLKNSSLPTLIEFLRKSKILDSRFPIRSDFSTNTFYLVAPPIYIDLVTEISAQIDAAHNNTEYAGEIKEKIEIIKLHNTFVDSRTFELREKTIIIPGIGSVLTNILTRDPGLAAATKVTMTTDDGGPSVQRETPSGGIVVGKDIPVMQKISAGSDGENSQVKIIAYPETNSLLIKGSDKQVRLIQNLVSKLDVPRRQIELSLWMIDISKNDLDQLGVNWQAGVSIGNVGKINFNNDPIRVTSLDGNRFLAAVTALSQKGNAQVVSRPIVLTQENIPAIFDSNHTFYSKLVGERNAVLEKVTFGTLISVLPRISGQSGDIEMILNIEDGMPSKSLGDTGLVDGLPVVSRTKINTVARVPQNLSLLIGGYSRDQTNAEVSKIPLLGDIPFIGSFFRFSNKNIQKLTRVFLIQPRVIDASDGWDAIQFDRENSTGRDISLPNTLEIMSKRLEDNVGYR
ncbi:type III secretion system outer membrane ring subunit SctC, partial [Herbaspirillum sp. RTI4]